MGKGRHRAARRTGLRGLKAQLMVLALVALVPSLAVGGAGAWMALNSYEQAYKERLRDGARSLSLVIERELEVTLSALHTLMASPALDEAERGNLASFREHARRAAENLGAPILLIDADLRIRFDSDQAQEAPPGARALGSATRRALETGRPGISNLMAGDSGRTPFIVVNVPILRAGEVRGVVATRIEAAHLSTLLATAEPGSGGFFASLLDSRMAIAARSEQADRYTGETVSLAQPLHEQRAGETEGRAADGRDMLFAFKSIANMPGWRILVGTPAAEYRAIWMRPMWAMAAGGALAAALSILAVTFLSRRILRPVLALRRQAEAVSRGSRASMALPEAVGSITEFAALQDDIAEADRTLRRQMEAERTATEALATSERRYRRLAEAGTVAVWRADTEGNILESRGWEVLTGQSPQELRGTGWLKAVHPDDIPGAVEDWMACVRDARPLDMQYRVRQVSGVWLWMRARGLPLFAEDGRPMEWIGVVEDVDARRRAEDMQRLLAREVDHRAKNVLSVVQAVVRLTQASDTPQFVAAVEARIAALARAHALLAHEGWVGADLRAIVEREFAPYTAGRIAADKARVRLEGPPVPLSPRVVQPLAIVLHELATNAAKHGALSVPAGSLLLRWSLDRALGTLLLEWEERGGPPVAEPPKTRGFGARIIEATIRNQLRGRIERHWEAEGLSCRITVPAAQALGAGDAAPDEAPAAG